MGKLTPLPHHQVIARLRKLGFEGPFAGGRHLLMVRGKVRLTIPNVHSPDVGVDLLARILRQAGISREQWESSK